MIGPEKLQSIPEQMAQLMRELQDWGIRDIAGRIARMGLVSGASENMLITLSAQDVFQTDLQKKIQEVLKVSDSQIEELFTQAVSSGYTYTKPMYAKAGLPFVPFEENYFMQSLTQNIIEQTQGDFANITRSMGFAVERNGKLSYETIADFYQRELNFATTKVAAGMQPFEAAVKEAVTRMADSGVRAYVDYPSGRKDRLDVAARRAVLGAMKELTVRQSEYYATEMGVTTFEFSWHGGHRPSHGWGGRRYDRLGVHYPRKSAVYEKYGGGTLDDYNCYHEEYAVFPDSPPKLTDEQLAQLEAKELEEIEFEGKSYNAYKARQQQRKMERVMRRQKSVIAGLEGSLVEDGALPEIVAELKLAKLRMRGYRKEYKEFSSVMGIPTEFERVNTGQVIIE